MLAPGSGSTKIKRQDKNTTISDKRLVLEMDYVCDRLSINISGAIYHTRERTLARFPDSLLGDPVKRKNYYCPEMNSYFFNRHRKAFESILYYYQSGGRLVLPQDIPLRLFYEEVEFFELGDEALCLVSKGLYAGKAKSAVSELLSRSQGAQGRMWRAFECPESSGLAKALSVFCIAMIVLSIILSCLTTSVHFQERHCITRCTNISNDGNETTTWSTTLHLCCKFSHKPMRVIVILDFVCYCWFLTEYLCRLASSPSKRQFFSSFLNFIDFVVIVPFFINYFIDKERIHTVSGVRYFVSVTRLLRLARIIKLSRYSRGLQALGSTLRASLRELRMMIMFLIMAVIISSCTVYLTEQKKPNSMIQSIPDGFWWSITTITTVGYGDSYPLSAGGKFIGSLCTVLGALAFSLPVIVFATNFRICYKSKDSITAEYHRNLRRQQRQGR